MTASERGMHHVLSYVVFVSPPPPPKHKIDCEGCYVLLPAQDWLLHCFPAAVDCLVADLVRKHAHCDYLCKKHNNNNFALQNARKKKASLYLPLLWRGIIPQTRKALHTYRDNNIYIYMVHCRLNSSALRRRFLSPRVMLILAFPLQHICKKSQPKRFVWSRTYYLATEKKTKRLPIPVRICIYMLRAVGFEIQNDSDKSVHTPTLW